LHHDEVVLETVTSRVQHQDGSPSGPATAASPATCRSLQTLQPAC
jgi:hypothetical protein